MASKNVYFFYFLLEKVYFSFYFSKFPKKIRSTKFFMHFAGVVQPYTGDHRDILKIQVFRKIPLFSPKTISEKIKIAQNSTR